MPQTARTAGVSLGNLIIAFHPQHSIRRARETDRRTRDPFANRVILETDSIAGIKTRRASLGGSQSYNVGSVLQDLRYAARSLRNNPGFTIVAALLIALGIGANCVIFSALNEIGRA